MKEKILRCFQEDKIKEMIAGVRILYSSHE